MQLADVEGIDDGVDRRVGVGKGDGDAVELLVKRAAGAEQCDAVQDVQWQPADDEEQQNQGQGLGQFQLLAVVWPPPEVSVVGCELETATNSGGSFHQFKQWCH